MTNDQTADSSEPRSIDGSLFYGDVSAERSIVVGRDLTLTVQGLTPADLDVLTERILEILRSTTPVTIAGGAGNTTVLAVDREPQIVVSRQQGLALARRTAGNVEAYLAGLVTHRDFGPWDTSYVALAGTAACPVTPEVWIGYVPVELRALCRRGEGPRQWIERIPVPDIAAAVRDYPQFVLLGEPGAGKTTVLQKVALDAARAWLQDETAPVPLFVRLSSYRGTEPPFDFLAEQWHARVGTDFASALQTGSVLLLLDALNEMPRADYAERVAAWQTFVRDWEGVRMVFTCRTLDYALPLPLHQVEISRLDDGRVRDFLACYVPNLAEALWEEIAHHPRGLLDLVRNPYLLVMLAWIYATAEEKRLPSNRGQLLASLVARLLEREQQRAHPDWIDTGALEQALSVLAWVLQEQGEGTSLPAEEALRVIPSQVMVRERKMKTKPKTVLRLGCAATLLEETLEGQVRFCHHLIQEYFAAREFLRRFDAGEDLHQLWKAPWWVREMPEPVDQTEWTPLPPPPPTGWEETIIVAAGLAADPTTLLEAVQAVNPILAGRCLDEGGAETADDLRERVRISLLDGMQDRRVHLRARITAGHMLGRLGDPRFVVCKQGRVRYIKPPLVCVPEGIYTIGSPWWDRQARDLERPRHRVQVEKFWIGQYPVRVAEYRCFIEAGGYQEQRYWESEQARAWLRGEEIEGGALEALLRLRRRLVESGRLPAYWEEGSSFRPQGLKTWWELAEMTEEEVREVLRSSYTERSRQEPAWWDDAAFNGANQPVIGVTWYEACAYCAWLAEVSNRPCRLPTEAEWEAAVCGGRTRLYPWGNRFDASRANTVEGRVLGTTPVGVYPQGVGPLGVSDGAGNVWEWTSSLHKPYPYRADDGREVLFASGRRMRRVLRGGSWLHTHERARCASREHPPPAAFDYGIGFRVVFPDPLPPPARTSL